jgi:hypothetical protein
MNDSRKKMLERIKAMLNTDGRTEAEMMAFLAKARELMATYEINEGDIAASEQEAATMFKSAIQDPYAIKYALGYVVGKFCRCEAWRDNSQRMFCGLESDIIFATWLLDTLQRFVMRALRAYQGDRAKKRIPNSNLTSSSFVAGCIEKIRNKLIALTPKYETSAIVKAEMAKKGIVLVKAKNNLNAANPYAHAAGAAAGDAARFDRPVGSSGTLRIGK